jgi:hypothetical protein
MTTPAESVVLCEGVHDRAFWKGWLSHLRCRDARPDLPAGGFGKARDPFGKIVEQGQFAFLSPAGSFVRVRPCNGDKGVLAELKKRLAYRTTEAVPRLVVGLDVDADVASPEVLGRIRDSIERRVRQADPAATTTGDGDFSIDGGATLVSVVLWCADDIGGLELPAHQTLERLVCSALRAAYPERAAAVAAWLATRPAPPPSTPKEHAWSHMAGWYADKNCDDFYQAVWRDDAVAHQLRARLEASGAWRIASALAA